MVFQYLTVELDVTPENWGVSFANNCGYAVCARAISEWLESKLAVVFHARTHPPVGLHEMQALTLSVTKPNVVMRMLMIDGNTTEQMFKFQAEMRKELFDVLELLHIESKKQSREEYAKEQAAS